VFYNKDGLTSYLGWEELERMKEASIKGGKAGMDISGR